MTEQTIFALSSGAGLAGIAVFRLSGDAALPTLERLTGLSSPTVRFAHRVVVSNSENKEIIDDGLALYFPGPSSFTGEDVVELHLHGSRAVCNEIISLHAFIVSASGFSTIACLPAFKAGIAKE